MEFEMYRIKKSETKIKVVCEACSKRGFILPNCNKCDGKGIRSKSLFPYKVATKPVKVIKVGRSNANTLRYWTSKDEYFSEEDMILHFSKEDAQSVCDRLNKASGDFTILTQLDYSKEEKSKTEKSESKCATPKYAAGDKFIRPDVVIAGIGLGAFIEVVSVRTNAEEPYYEVLINHTLSEMYRESKLDELEKIN